MIDVVYAVKPDEFNEELRYSLRSIAKNLKHDQVFISGYMPPFLNPETCIHIDSYNKPLIHDPRNSRHRNRYQDAESNWIGACTDERVSSNFILMNDDFFIMKPVKRVMTYHDGDLQEAINRRIQRFGKVQYALSMQNTHNYLTQNGYTNLKSYAVHVPTIINKTKRLKISELQCDMLKNGNVILARTLYGNIFNIGGKEIQDVKVSSWLKDIPKNTTYLSTNNRSFAVGEVGKYIRSKFPDKCCYEL
jgi:hypothetical protein